MAEDEGIFCTQAEMLQKAGANVSSIMNAATDTTFVYSNSFIGQAESEINAKTLINWSDIYATLNADNRDLLKMAASARAAMFCISYDTDGYGSRQAETMLDILNDQFQSAIKQLKDKDVSAFVVGT